MLTAPSLAILAMLMSILTAGWFVGLTVPTVFYCSGQLILKSLACMDPLDSEVGLVGQEPGTSQKSLGRLDSMMFQERRPDG